MVEGLALEGRMSREAIQRVDTSSFAATREAVMARGKRQN